MAKKRQPLPEVEAISESPDAETVEASLLLLESLAGQIKDSSTPLEKAISIFEEGMTITHSLRKKLDTLEKKVKILVETDSGKVKVQDFEEATEKPRLRKKQDMDS